MDEQLEIERKYDAPADAAVPDLSAAAGIGAAADPVVHELAATYFDTPDLRLLASRVTLRRRVGGAESPTAGSEMATLRDRVGHLARAAQGIGGALVGAPPGARWPTGHVSSRPADAGTGGMPPAGTA